jgi:predicted regulator of Ras-like GTPase activity (Roadblock/LC7/MglB family)
MTGDRLLAEMQALRDRITGVTGTAVASRDGLIIREDTGGVNPDNLAALTSAALSLVQRLARKAGQGALRESVTRSSGGYVAIYAIGTSAVLVLLGDEGLDVTRMHRESRSVVENIEKLLALTPAPGTVLYGNARPETALYSARRGTGPYSARPRIEASSTSAVCATAMS